MVLKDFIVFEGIDGAGTSTQINKLVEYNPDRFVATCEPTSGATGKFLRQMLSGDFTVDEKTNAFLFAADRCEHIYGKGGIIETINKGKIVLSDRYFFSSLAYQSISCGEEYPYFVNSKFPLPEYLFFFEINPEISLARVDSRNEKKEIYEKLGTQKKIAAKYNQVISQYENSTIGETMKVIRIDASKGVDEIATEIRNKLSL